MFLSPGLILSFLGNHSINNLSHFFTPPDGNKIFTEDLLKINFLTKVGNGIEDNDAKALTLQNKSFLINAIDLTQQI